LLVSALYLVVCRLLELIVLFGRGDRAKELEILVLGNEVSILRRQVNRPRLQPHDRLLLAAFSRMLPRGSWNAFFVQAETVLSWQRRLVARRWTLWVPEIPGQSDRWSRTWVVRSGRASARTSRPGFSGSRVRVCLEKRPARTRRTGIRGSARRAGHGGGRDRGHYVGH
jgi:hypothetical protein